MPLGGLGTLRAAARKLKVEHGPNDCGKLARRWPEGNSINKEEA
jgi:hypothetical protein